MRVAYFYLMQHDPGGVGAVGPDHAAYWRELDLPGPLADRSGGLITFSAGSIEEAELLTARDPFVRAGVIGRVWLKEWVPNGGESSGRDQGTERSGSSGR